MRTEQQRIVCTGLTVKDHRMQINKGDPPYFLYTEVREYINPSSNSMSDLLS